MLYEITILCYLFFPTRSSYPLHPSTVACVPGRRILTEKYNNIYCVLFNAIIVYNMFFKHFFCLVDLLLFFFHRFRHILIPTRYGRSAGGYPSDPTDLDLHVVHNISGTGTTHVDILCDLCVGGFFLIILFSYIDCIYFTASISFFFSLKLLKHDF